MKRAQELGSDVFYLVGLLLLVLLCVGVALYTIQTLSKFIVDTFCGLLTWAWWRMYRLFVRRVDVSYAASPENTAGGNKATRSLEFANPTCPSSPLNSNPWGVGQVLNSANVQIGDITACKSPDTKPFLLTCWHVYKLAVGERGDMTVEYNGRAFTFKPQVMRAMLKEDQVWLHMPPGLCSVLGLKQRKVGEINFNLPVSVFSPPRPGDECMRSSSSMARPGKKALRVEYAASTAAGSSGSPLLQGDTVVGVHIGGEISPEGLVTNHGSALMLRYPSQRIYRDETVEKASGQRAYSMVDYDDFDVSAGFEEIDDFLDLKPELRGTAVHYRWRRSGPLILTKPKKVSDWTPTGDSWADLVDMELDGVTFESKQENCKAEEKSFPPRFHKATTITRQMYDPDSVSAAILSALSASTSAPSRRKLPVVCDESDGEESCDPTPSPVRNLLTSEPKISSLGSESGALPTGAQQQNCAPSSTRRKASKMGKNPPTLSRKVSFAESSTNTRQ
jgi:hypothetical protein